jgi:S1-C subfamily serine protease
MKRVFLALSILTIAVLACNQTLPAAPPQPTPAVQVQTNPALQPVVVNPAEQQDALVTLYDQVIPGVVAIRTDSGALGSGFVFDGEGHVVTNQHVVDGASTFEVAFSSGFKRMGP